MGIIPNRQVVIRETSFNQVMTYFLGPDWASKYSVAILGVRNPRLNFYDDECALWTNKGVYQMFPFNTEPAAYSKRGRGMAFLRKGLHFYTLSYHKKWNSRRRYFALNPDTPGRELPVLRGRAQTKTTGVALNIHEGGNSHTYSEGCQTIPPKWYDRFIKAIADALNVRIRLGTGVSLDRKFSDGVGRIPYILIDQTDFNRITKGTDLYDIDYKKAEFVGFDDDINRPIPVTEEEDGDEVDADLVVAPPLDEMGPATVPGAHGAAGLGDPPDAPPRFFHKIEDWREKIEQWRKRATTTFGTLTLPAIGGPVWAAVSDPTNRPYWIALGIVLLIVLGLVAWRFSGFLDNWFNANRKELGDGFQNQARTLADPTKYNYGLKVKNMKTLEEYEVNRGK